jgi:outer membrane protein OmpA-like peptidoglycan-associated protein
MRRPFLASALALLMGSGIAYANDDTQTQQQQSSTTKSQSQSTQKENMGGMHENVQNVDLFFETDSAQLGDTSTSDLQSLADWAKCDTRNAIILEGSADPRGSQDHNLKLSGERAATVRQKLIDLGVPSQRIVVSVFGENRKEGSFAHRRRVTARAAQTPVAPDDLAG